MPDLKLNVTLATVEPSSNPSSNPFGPSSTVNPVKTEQAVLTIHNPEDIAGLFGRGGVPASFHLTAQELADQYTTAELSAAISKKTAGQ